VRDALTTRFVQEYTPYTTNDCGTPDTQGQTSLNLHRTYMASSTSFSTQREFIQNWIDRCRELTSGGVHVKFVRHAVGDGCLVFYGVIEGNNSPRSLGYIAELIGGNSIPIKTYMCNFGTVLSKGVMVLGKSTKRLSNESAGYYGEGVKVSINRLSASNIHVSYHTGHNLWHFSYDSNDVLHLYSKQHNPTPHTTVLIEQTHSSSPLMPCINAEDYLFLYRAVQPNLAKFSLRSKELEIICYPTLLNRIYIKDISCYSSDALSVKIQVEGKETKAGVALNYVGPPDRYSTLGLGRDRNMVDVDAFIRLIPNLFAQDSGLSFQEKKELANHLYVMLANDQNTETFGQKLYIGTFGIGDQIIKQLANFLYWALNCKLPQPLSENNLFRIFPYEKYDKEVAKQAAYLGAYLQEVPRYLCKMLCKSAYYMSIKEHWDRCKLDAIQQPDFDTDQLRGFISSLKNAINRCFEIPLDAIWFKAFPINNTTPNQTIAIDFDLNDEKLASVLARQNRIQNLREKRINKVIIIDGNLLDRDTVHLLKSKEFAECTFVDNTTCDCVQVHVIQSIKKLLCNGSSAMEKRFEENMISKYFETFGNELPKSPEKPRARVPQPAPYGSTTPSGVMYDLTGDDDNDNPVAGSYEQVPTSAKPKGPEPKPSDYKRIEADILEAVTQASRHTCSVSDKKNSMKKIKKLVNEENETPKTNLVKIGKVHVDPIYQRHVNIKTAEFFEKKIIHPLASIFNYNIDKVHLFWEDKSTIAFNRGGQLFYNIRYFEEVHYVEIQKNSAAVASALTWWYVVFAHEVAHNVAEGHDKQHESVEEVLIQTNLMKLVNCVNRLL
jgi:hypothetical protein